MPDWMWIELGIIGALALVGVGVAALVRGIRVGVKDVFLDVPGPNTKILREKKTSRAYVESDLAIATALQIADNIEERNNLRAAFLPRAMERTEDRFDTFLYAVDDVFRGNCCSDDDSLEAWEDAFPAITGNLRRRLVEERFKPSFLYNGFYDYKTLGPGGERAVTRAWTDYITERVESIGSYVQHYLKNKVRAKPQIQTVVQDIESGELRLKLHAAVSDIYDWYWELHHQMKAKDKELIKEYVKLQASLKGTEGGK